MLQPAHICLAVRFRCFLQNSLGFGYIAFWRIYFAIIELYASEKYRPIFTLSSTMPSVLHILRWSIIGFRCFFLSFPSTSSPSSPSYPLTLLIARSKVSSSVEARCRWLAVGMASPSSFWSPSTLLLALPHGIPKCSSSSMQLLSLWMFGSVLQMSGSRSTTLEVQWSRRIALSTRAESTLRTTAGIGFSACWIWRLTLQECIYTPSVGSSAVVCFRYSSTMYTCLQRQARLTTCNLLQRSRMHHDYRHACSWSSSSDQVCPLSGLTWKLSDEHLCSVPTSGEHGATRCGWTWSVARVFHCPCHQSWNDKVHQHTYCDYSPEDTIQCWYTLRFLPPGSTVDAGHLFGAFNSLCVGFGPYTPPSIPFTTGKRDLLSARRESMNSTCSALDSKRWRWSSYAISSIADWIKWDVT